MYSIKGFLHREYQEVLQELAKANSVKVGDMVKQINDDIKRKCAASVTKAKVMQEKITEMLNTLLQKIADSQNST